MWKHEVGRAAFGLEKLESGSVVRNGKEIKTCLQRLNPESDIFPRTVTKEALILDGSIQDNIVTSAASVTGAWNLHKPGF